MRSGGPEGREHRGAGKSSGERGFRDVTETQKELKTLSIRRSLQLVEAERDHQIADCKLIKARTGGKPKTR